MVIDPRVTATSQAATDHLQIQPKSDLALFYGLAHILIREGWIDERFIAVHTTGFAEFAEFVKAYTPESVAQSSGIPEEKLHEIANLIHTRERVSFWWTMGVNQSYEGTRAAQSLINLALMTGNIGRPGTGANSISGQCNAMGSRILSNTTTLLGGRSFLDAEDRAEVAGILGIDEKVIPAQNSLSYYEIIDAIDAGKIKGLWLIATNTAHSWIHQNGLKDVFKKLEFLVVQDMYHSTESAQLAHLVLPAAGWGEKEGFFINSERRLGLSKRVSKAPGQALSDFAICKLIAHYWGCGPMFDEWRDPESAFQILKRLVKDQPCDFSGIEDYRHLDASGGIQWPLLEEERQSFATERRLFEDGKFFTPDGRARFIFEAPRPMPEPTDAEYPMLLLTGRGTASQWHTQTRTAKSAVLRTLYPKDAYVEINPEDAARMNLAANEKGARDFAARGNWLQTPSSIRRSCPDRFLHRCTTTESIG